MKLFRRSLRTIRVEFLSNKKGIIKVKVTGFDKYQQEYGSFEAYTKVGDILDLFGNKSGNFAPSPKKNVK